MLDATPFEIASELDAGTARLSLLGELDLATAPQLEQSVGEALAQGAGEILIDLSRLSFIDSSGLRLFILLNDRAGTDGWRLALTRPPEPSRAVFQITGAEENLPFIGEPPAA
jgi:anti-sigma B factor antagonist